MLVKDMIKEAKNNNEEAIKELEIYYLDIFKNNVKRFCGEEYIEEAMYDYSSLIRKYINGNYIEAIDCFLRRNSKLYPKEKFLKKQLGDKLDFNNEDNISFVINHYADVFFEKIKDYNNILNEEDLFIYSLNLIKYLVFNLKFNNDFRVILNGRMHREIEKYKNNEEYLIIKYILFNGYNERIIKYFSNKYAYKKQEYNNTFIHNIVTNKFDNIVKESLDNLTDVNESIKFLIEKRLIKVYKEEREKQKEYITNAKNGSSVAFGILYNNYSYIVNVIYDKYKDDIELNPQDLKNIIKEKYKQFMYAYINGNSNVDINKYLSTRLNDYMRNSINKHIYSGTVVDENNMYLKLIENEIDKVLEYVPKDEAKIELEEACLKLLRKREYSKRVNTNLKSSLNTCIRNKINTINKRYVDDCASKGSMKVKHPTKK